MKLEIQMSCRICGKDCRQIIEDIGQMRFENKYAKVIKMMIIDVKETRNIFDHILIFGKKFEKVFGGKYYFSSFKYICQQCIGMEHKNPGWSKKKPK